MTDFALALVQPHSQGFSSHPLEISRYKGEKEEGLRDWIRVLSFGYQVSQSNLAQTSEKENHIEV